MRLRHLVSSLVVIGSACAPATSPEAVITPELIESAPRYRLVYQARGEEIVSAKVVDQVQLFLQRELATRGYLAAAPWEEPTVEVRFAVAELAATQLTGPSQPQMAPNPCHTDTREADGCAHSVWDNVPQLSSTRVVRHVLAVELRRVGGSDVLWHNTWDEEGHWTSARPELNRTIVRLVLNTLAPSTRS